jgi:adenylate kinase family enzyme
MKKVIIIGCPGSGKTRLAKILAEKTGLPLIHLDKTYHSLSLNRTDKFSFKNEWRSWQQEQITKETWIIDGNYKGTLDLRVPAADTIIFLDYPRSLSLWRVFKRRIQHHRNPREDMPADWKEKISPDFLKFIWHYRKIERPLLLALLEKYRVGRNILIFTHPAEAAEYLKNLNC